MNVRAADVRDEKKINGPIHIDRFGIRRWNIDLGQLIEAPALERAENPSLETGFQIEMPAKNGIPEPGPASPRPFRELILDITSCKDFKILRAPFQNKTSNAERGRAVDPPQMLSFAPVKFKGLRTLWSS